MDFSKSSAVIVASKPQTIRGLQMAPNLMRAALAMLVLGWAPILLYAMYGPADGNPIGLGILAWASVPLALALAASSGVVFLVKNLRHDHGRA